MKKCSCGCKDFYTEKHGNNIGLYCKSCGKWQKWLNKDEVRAFEHQNGEYKNDDKIENLDTRYITDLISLKRNLDTRIDEEINEELFHNRGNSKNLIDSLLYRIEEDSRFFTK